MAVQNGLGNRTLTTHTMRAVKQMIRGLTGGAPAFAFTNASAPPATTGGSHGVGLDGDLKVTAQVTPNMTVAVAPGFALILQDANAHAGSGTIYNDASLNVTITTANATNPRIDLIVAQMRDNVEDASGQNDWQIVAVAGTPAASPVVPTIPPGCLVLAEVRVDAAVSSIVAGKVTERRSFISAIGGRQRWSAATLPTASFNYLGRQLIKTATGTRLFWNGSQWRGEVPLRVINTGSANSGIGTGALVVNTFSLPDVECNGTWDIHFYLQLTQTVATDVFRVSIINLNTSGTIGYHETDGGANTKKIAVGVSQGLGVNAGDSIAVGIEVARLSGTGTATTVATAYLNKLTCYFWPTT